MHSTQHQVDLGVTENPYAAEHRLTLVRFTSKRLTVDHEGSRATADLLSQITEFEAIIHLGFDENADKLKIESQAANENDFRIPDNSGRKVNNEPIESGMREFLKSTAPFHLLCAELADESLIERSDCAGRFLCNETYFRTLSCVENLGLKDSHNRALPVIFVHIPSDDKVALKELQRLVVKIAGIAVNRPQMKVVGGLLRDERERLLAARRAEKEWMGGFWEFPGGKLEIGESEKAALAREWREEFGWEIEPIRVCEQYSHAWPEMVVDLSFWVCRPIGELPEAVLTSHDEYRWLSQANLLSVEWMPPDVEFVMRLQKRGIANL